MSRSDNLAYSYRLYRVPESQIAIPPQPAVSYITAPYASVMASAAYSSEA